MQVGAGQKRRGPMRRIDATIVMEEVTGIETEERLLYVFAAEDRFIKMKAPTKEDAQVAKEPIGYPCPVIRQDDQG
jgi:hypothetical protein